MSIHTSEHSLLKNPIQIGPKSQFLQIFFYYLKYFPYLILQMASSCPISLDSVICQLSLSKIRFVHRILLLGARISGEPGVTCTFSRYMSNCSRATSSSKCLTGAYFVCPAIGGTDKVPGLTELVAQVFRKVRAAVLSRWQPLGPQSTASEGNTPPPPKASPLSHGRGLNAVGERGDHSAAFLPLCFLTCKLS